MCVFNNKGISSNNIIAHIGLSDCDILRLSPFWNIIMIVMTKNTPWEIIQVSYGTHQLQLKCDIRGTCRGHMSYAHMFCDIHAITHTVNYLCVYTRSCVHPLFTQEVQFYLRTCVLDVPCINTTFTSLVLQ